MTANTLRLCISFRHGTKITVGKGPLWIKSLAVPGPLGCLEPLSVSGLELSANCDGPLVVLALISPFLLGGSKLFFQKS